MATPAQAIRPRNRPIFRSASPGVSNTWYRMSKVPTPARSVVAIAAIGASAPSPMSAIDGRHQRDENHDQQVDVERILGLPEAEVLGSADGGPADRHGSRNAEPRQKADDEQGNRRDRCDELALRQPVRVQFASSAFLGGTEPISPRRPLPAWP